MIAQDPSKNLILGRGAEPDEIPNRSASPFGLTKPTEGRSVSHNTFRSRIRIRMMRIYYMMGNGNMIEKMKPDETSRVPE